MPRSYTNVSMYEKEILELLIQGKSLREIGNILGLNYDQVHNFKSRYNKKQKMLAAGIAIKKKGRPRKDSVVTEEESLAILRYKLNCKEERIKQLEMENELMRDFLLLTERK